MRIIKVLPSFERSLKRLPFTAKKKVKKTLKQLNDFLITGTLPKGLGLKKINKDKYEIRVDISLRIIIKMEREDIYLVLIGSHEDIKRYLKEFN